VCVRACVCVQVCACVRVCVCVCLLNTVASYPPRAVDTMMLARAAKEAARAAGRVMQDNLGAALTKTKVRLLGCVGL
jgi:hypothetical protein